MDCNLYLLAIIGLLIYLVIYLSKKDNLLEFFEENNLSTYLTNNKTELINQVDEYIRNDPQIDLSKVNINKEYPSLLRYNDGIKATSIVCDQDINKDLLYDTSKLNPSPVNEAQINAELMTSKFHCDGAQTFPSNYNLLDQKDIEIMKGNKTLKKYATALEEKLDKKLVAADLLPVVAPGAEGNDDDWFSIPTLPQKNPVEIVEIDIPEFRMGVPSVSCLRNASHDLRGDVPCPQFPVSPWNQSTILANPNNGLCNKN